MCILFATIFDLYFNEYSFKVNIFAENGRTNSTLSHLEDGVQLEISCDSGYALYGDPIITCEKGSWSGIITPECRPEDGNWFTKQILSVKYRWAEYNNRLSLNDSKNLKTLFLSYQSTVPISIVKFTPPILFHRDGRRLQLADDEQRAFLADVWQWNS